MNARDCCWSMPGNHPCPYEAVYYLSWVHGPDRLTLHRRVCLPHLSAAIDDALKFGWKNEAVFVRSLAMWLEEQ